MKEERLLAYQLLEIKMAELDVAHGEFHQVLYESDVADAEVAKELESNDKYRTQFPEAKMKVMSLTVLKMENVAEIPRNFALKTLKPLTIELPKFNGNIRECFLFWSQFKKINDNQSLSKENKF